MGKLTPTSPADRERAIELMAEAFHSPDEQTASRLAQEALKTDPNNADIYVYLGNESESPEEAMDWYQKGVEVGKALIEDRMDQLAGHMWMEPEARPYLRALYALADFNGFQGEIDKAIGMFEELLKLNPMDNQGARYDLLQLYFQQDQIEDATRLMKQFEDDQSADWKYGAAILSYLNAPEDSGTAGAWKEAVAFNPHVLGFLTGEKEPPAGLPMDYAPGSEEEAVLYVARIFPLLLSKPMILRFFLDDLGVN
ncbi:tetratricopeptide repeat protein [Pontibacter sp. G13]|uniref:tetratricopeptide repeat protein n=1 Tax=Pontibacter sp. G13 TaxID=3074898 RepID=UPI00288B1606|nr:tetratricopeptide repeat protein [Pontibacter sp. G13]WNJ21033.1 tetratricopeptide repeat protein [Pontibacter sp. G13]